MLVRCSMNRAYGLGWAPPTKVGPRLSGLLAQSDLRHVRLVVPEQVFLIHRPALPVADRTHDQREGLSGRRDCLAFADGHRLRERSLHDTDNAGPFAIGDLDRVLLDAGVGCVHKHSLQVGDVPVDAVSDVSIWPVHGDVRGVALLQAIPLLVGEYVKVERVELGNVRLEGY